MKFGHGNFWMLLVLCGCVRLKTANADCTGSQEEDIKELMLILNIVHLQQQSGYQTTCTVVCNDFQFRVDQMNALGLDCQCLDTGLAYFKDLATGAVQANGGSQAIACRWPTLETECPAVKVTCTEVTTEEPSTTMEELTTTTEEPTTTTEEPTTTTEEPTTTTEEPTTTTEEPITTTEEPIIESTVEQIEPGDEVTTKPARNTDPATTVKRTNNAIMATTITEDLETTTHDDSNQDNSSNASNTDIFVKTMKLKKVEQTNDDGDVKTTYVLTSSEFHAVFFGYGVLLFIIVILIIVACCQRKKNKEIQNKIAPSAQ